MQKNINIFNYTYQELEDFFQAMQQPKFRTKQLSDWLYKKFVFDPKYMLNFPKGLQEVLTKDFSFSLPQIHHSAYSEHDGSYKFLLKADDGALIESILMLEKSRSTLCVSCMVGCPLKCLFCATGSQIGFIRKLTTAEIVGQLLTILCYAHEYGLTDRITNVVFMGMGEPLLNKEAVEKAIALLTHQQSLALSPSKISVSTAGVCTGLVDFIHKTGVRLAVSLHFTTDELRSEYMPINKRFPIKELITELQKIKLKKRDYVLIEYMMMHGINDSLTQAKQLHKLVANLKVKINLIPYNPTEMLSVEASSEAVINDFATYLRDKGIFTSVRRSRGVTVYGGCGQFALKKS